MGIDDHVIILLKFYLDKYIYEHTHNINKSMQYILNTK